MKEKLIAFFRERKNVYLMFAFSGGVIATLLVALVVIMLTAKPPAKSPVVSDEEKEQILTEIIRNNPEGIITVAGSSAQSITEEITEEETRTPGRVVSGINRIAEDTTSPISKTKIPAPDEYSTGEIDPVDDGDIVAPDLSLYNYRYSSTTVVPGAALDVCNYYGYDAPRRSEYYEYFDPTHAYYLNIDTVEGELDQYHLGLYGNDVNEVYVYEDGQFGVRYQYDIDPGFSIAYEPVYPDSAPDSGPDSYSGPASYPDSYTVWDYFGYNADVIDRIVTGDKTYFIVESSYSSYCDSSEYGRHEFITRFKVDADSFQIVERSIYLDQVRADNLLFTELVTTETRTVTHDDVAAQFGFSRAPVRTLDYRGYVWDGDAVATAVADKLEQMQVTLLLPADDDIQLWGATGSGLYDSVRGTDYHYERAFYPETPLGQAKYDRVQEHLKNTPLISIYGYNDSYYGFLEIDTYTDSQHSAESLQEYIISSSEDSLLTRSDAQLIVDTAFKSAHKSLFE
ncbi:MAG: hypothetical protein TR69_WS6001001391, partial [candidate division WS6 bacterium OLB20]